MNREHGIGCGTAEGRVLVGKNRLPNGIQAEELRQRVLSVRGFKCIVDEVVKRRILIDRRAEGTNDILTRLKIPIWWRFFWELIGYLRRLS